MAVRSGKLLDVVVSQTKAKIYISIAWMYSLLLALLRLFLDHFDYLGPSIPLVVTIGYGRAIWALSNLILIFLVMMVQLSTYIKIRKRVAMAIGSVNATQGLNNLYKRAMKKSTLVAVCFALGWGPMSISMLAQDWTALMSNSWTIENYGASERRLMAVLTGVSLLQGFTNAIIFRPLPEGGPF